MQHVRRHVGLQLISAHRQSACLGRDTASGKRADWADNKQRFFTETQAAPDGAADALFTAKGLNSIINIRFRHVKSRFEGVVVLHQVP